MSETAAASAETAKTKVKPVLTALDRAKNRNARKKARKARREKLAPKLVADREFAKTYFGAKSKRSGDKKVAFRKKKARKK